MNRSYFTVAEVNAMLPRVHQAARKVQRGAIRLSELSKVLFGEGPPQSDTMVDGEYMADVDALTEGMEAIIEMGGEIKDLSKGLVDFPSLYQGREVLLCWRPGEESVCYWHDTDAGFAGRAAIENEDDFRGDPEGKRPTEGNGVSAGEAQGETEGEVDGEAGADALRKPDGESN
jgi:hypothetical protein